MLSRRALLRLTMAAPLLAACDARPLYGIVSPTATTIGAPTRRRVRLWHGDAVNGERAFAREVGPRLAAQLPDVQVEPLAYGDPDELLRRVTNAAAGGIGPDVLQLPGEWLPEAVSGKLVTALPQQLAPLLDPKDWTPNTVESGRWNGTSYGLPAAVLLRQPYYNDELLRNAGLIEIGRTTPPNSWAEFADVSKRVSAPDERWGSQMPSARADETLVRHVLQHVHAAGGELPRREGTRVSFDTPPMREALQYLLELVQKNGAVPLDKQLFRLAESGKLGLWWDTTGWLGDASATGSTLRVGAVPVPKNRRGGAVVRTLHWCRGAYAGQPDAAIDVLTGLADDETSHRYCAALWLPPTRRASWTRPLYAQPSTPSAGKVWPAALDQLNNSENVALVGFPGYRTAAARIAGELVLVLTGKKPIPAALAEGEAGVAELLKQADEGTKP